MARLILTGPYEGQTIKLGKCQFVNGVCELTGLSEDDAEKRGHLMNVNYKTRLEAGSDSTKPAPKPQPDAEEAVGASDSDKLDREAAAPPTPQRAGDGAAARAPSLTGNTGRRSGNARRD